MSYAEIDRDNMEIRIIYPTNSSVKKLVEYEEELNNYPIKIIPQNTITDEQMRLLYVLFKQYGEEIGYTMVEMKELLKEMFCFNQEMGDFSLSPYKKNPLTKEQATEFLQFIIEQAIENGVNLYIKDTKTNSKRHISRIVPDIQRYTIKCLKTKICAVCGDYHSPDNNHFVELDHYDNVSSTATTYDLDDGLQGRFISLCHKHHLEKHNIGREKFENKYYLEGIYLNEQLVYDLLDVYPSHFKLFKKRLKENFYKNIVRRTKWH